jgi:hypothetical protein
MEQNPFVRCVDVHKIIPEVMPNIYYLFETGGPHYFSKCTCEVESIYKQNIWPFIYRVKNKFKATKSGVIYGSIGLTKLAYVWVRLYSIDKTRNFERYRYSTRKTEIRPKELHLGLHRLVAKAFIKNNDPANKVVVDHLNGNRIDYRVENLRWCTPTENSKGTPGGKNDPNKIYKLISKKNWFNGKGNNMIETQKDIYFKNLKNL